MSLNYDCIVLVLQGGGSLGAYQAGVYEGMAEAGYVPDWVAGTSIGAINGALIVGNPPARRVTRLREFWNLVSSGLAGGVPAGPLTPADPLRRIYNGTSAATAALFGVPGFFKPRMPPAALMPTGHPGAVSLYSNEPLLATLTELADFKLINRRDIRYSAGAVNVRSGNSHYFDNTEIQITPHHVAASGALPPGFAPVEIDGEHYWDGGIVSNTPLWHVMDASPPTNTLVVQVDLFSARGEMPGNLDEAMERQKDIRYSSKTRTNTSRVLETQELREALQRVLKKLPPELREDKDVKLLAKAGAERRIDIVHLINRRFTHASHTKDFEFSRTTVRELWECGLEDARITAAHPDWLQATRNEGGVRVFDATRIRGRGTA
jgi:NTE family protein